MADLSPPSRAQDAGTDARCAVADRAAFGKEQAPGQPAVSIVLPVHNGERYLATALESILGQSFADFELIAVDDCSSDGSPAILAGFAARDSRMRVVTLAENAKLPGALNAGFREARADWLTWTSDDNILHPAMLEALLAERVGAPQADILYAGYRVIDAQGHATGAIEPGPPGELLSRNVVGCCFLYRRTVHEALGGYDESLFGAEDYDFWLRAARAGFAFHPIERQLYDYRRHQASLTDRRWFENREKVERMLAREIDLAPRGRARAAAWLSLFLGNPYTPRPRFLWRALRENPRLAIARARELAGWTRRAIAWRVK